MNASETLKKIINILGAAKKVAVFCHMRPDGDTLGAALGLRAALGDKADVYCDSEISDYYDVFPNIGAVLRSKDLQGEYDAFAAVDCAEPARLGMYEKKFLKHKNSIAVDHHATNGGFAALDHIAPSASSTCEIMLNVIRELGGLNPLSAL